MDVLRLLRESIMTRGGNDIEQQGTKLRIGESIVPLNAPTAFLKKLERTPYTVGALWGVYKHHKKPFMDYVASVESEGLDRVVVLDRPVVYEYLTGERSGEEYIDPSLVSTSAKIEMVSTSA